MIWQDWVLGGAGLGFAVMLLPVMVDSEARVSRWTSVPNAALCWLVALAQESLGLELGAFGSILCMGAWLRIAVWRARR